MTVPTYIFTDTAESACGVIVSAHEQFERDAAAYLRQCERERLARSHAAAVTRQMPRIIG